MFPTDWPARTSSPQKLAVHLPSDAENRLPISIYTSPPWLSEGRTIILPNLPDRLDKSSDKNILLEATKKMILDHGADFTLYSGGSGVRLRGKIKGRLSSNRNYWVSR